MVFRFNATLSATGYASRPAASGEIGRFICYTTCATPYPLSLMLRSPQGLCRKASLAGHASRPPVLICDHMISISQCRLVRYRCFWSTLPLIPRSPQGAMLFGQPRRACGAPSCAPLISGFNAKLTALGYAERPAASGERDAPSRYIASLWPALAATRWARRPSASGNESALLATSSSTIFINQCHSAPLFLVEFIPTAYSALAAPGYAERSAAPGE